MSKKLEEYTKEELLETVKALRRRKKFGLVWEDKPEKVALQCQSELPVLKEELDKAITNSKELPTNYIIEGDNYHSLSVLNYTHADKVDVIYIDPPYNTGNKDFVYNDRIVDKEDTFRHSKWLSFMSKRLQLAKGLLKDEGVIFISIDDNEYANLKLLCDLIFDESNCIGPFIQNKLNAKNDTLNIQKNHEYILVYRNNEIKANGKTQPTLVNKKITVKQVIKEADKFFYLSDPITTRGEGGILNARKNLGYTVYYNQKSGDFKGVMDYDTERALTSNVESEVYSTDNKLIQKGYEAVRPPKVRGKLGAWTWDCDRFNNHLDEIYIKKTRTGFTVSKKVFVDASEVYEEGGKYLFNSVNQNGNSRSIIEFSTNDGTDEYNQILEAGSFNNPKNVEMMKFLISLYADNEALVLDFFAGSGTTGQAVLELNREDGGNRRFILGTNNENEIAENITYQRIRKVIEGYGKSDPHSANVRYFKTDFVSKKKTDDQTRAEMVDRSTDTICLRENTFEKIVEHSAYKVFGDSTHYAAIVFEPDLIEELKEELSKVGDSKPVHLYVFSLSSDTYESDFTDLDREHELIPIPDSILEVYRRIFSTNYQGLGA